jgi:amino acid adenylation domain-containing protein/thioester reductase-like protein
MRDRGEIYANDPLGRHLQEQLIPELSEYLKAKLPPYMVPSTFVMLEKFSLTANGKIDRYALPAPDLETYVGRTYETPLGAIEKVIAEIWQDLLGIERVGRLDNFFELGGHSLLIVQMLERLRRIGLTASVRSVYANPVVRDLAHTLSTESVVELEVPPNRIPAGCTHITPQMLTLVELDSGQIGKIVQSVPGGAENVQDIYPLVPLQDGMLFHHLLRGGEGDAYALPTLLLLSSRETLRKLIDALQAVIDRHDARRSAILWEELPRPVQVVYRHSTLPVEELQLDQLQDPIEQLEEWLKPGRQRLDLRKAPLMGLKVAADPDGVRWYALLQLHHIICDHESQETMLAEVMTCVEGRLRELPQPGAYRNHVAQALAHARTHDAEAFFREKFRDVVEPTAPYALLDVHGDGSRIEEVRQTLEADLTHSLRALARRLSVSVATLFHAAWAMVVSRTSGRDDVVFGTVLLGRLQGRAGAQQILGMFLNTLPIRLQLRSVTAQQLVEQTQRELIELLGHEQAPLALAQRCSGVVGSAPLFTSLLNYLHGTPSRAPEKAEMAPGIRMLSSPEWTNFPIALSVEDQRDRLVLVLDTDRRIDPRRMLGYMSTALSSLVKALQTAPETAALALTVLPESERWQVIRLFNSTRADFSREALIHELFQEQVRRTPGAIAAIYEQETLTYAELNGRANRLAYRLRERGIRIGEYVPILMPRCLRMLVAQLAILKCGAVYVPVDPKLPVERLLFIICDCGARLAVTERGSYEGIQPEPLDWIEVTDRTETAGGFPDSVIKVRMETSPPAYVMYTSGSTGTPKGVIVPHCAVNRLVINSGYVRIEPTDRVAHHSNPAFDASTFEIWAPLLNGASVLIVEQSIVLEADRFAELLWERGVTVLWMTVSLFALYADALAAVFGRLRYLLVGGEAVEPWVVRRVLRRSPPWRLLNGYGPTECTTFAATYRIEAVDEETKSIPIGRPIANTQIYILDTRLEPAPIGVTGEIYIGGAGVAVGYLNRPELSAERFVPDPFGGETGARLYRTGDLGHWMADGNIEYLGRNDQQVKMRGFRIEPGEIEVHLLKHSQVNEVAVVVREDEQGEKRLVAYVVTSELFRGETAPTAESLRTHLKPLLPEYMVPSVFVALKHLPLTANGKLDRRALPAPEAGAFASREHIPPEGKAEQMLAGVWHELLRVERIGRDDNFFELGGHSLLALRAIFKINKQSGSVLRVADLYRSPTLRELAAHIVGNAPVEELVDLSKEARLDLEIGVQTGRLRIPVQKVMLTGATGFVGRFLLAQLLQETNANVYCLIRAGSSQLAESRLRKTLSKWDLWSDEFEKRIIAVPGDLSQPQLGIDDGVYESLCKETDSIYHCGTSMNHLESYRMAKHANVEGSRELIKIAMRNTPKLVNYISTLDVFGPQESPRVVSEESSIDNERHFESRGYEASKWIGEKIFVTAGDRGLPVNVFRLGLVWADTRLGRYDELQREYRIFKSCLLSGYGIADYRFEMAPTPVDYVARAVVFLAGSHCHGGGIFHVSSSGPESDGVFERCNEIGAMSLELLPLYDWIQKIKQLHYQGRSLPAVPLLEFAFSMDRESFYEYHRGVSSRRARVDCTRTHRELERAGIVAAPPGNDVMKAYIAFMLSRDAELRDLTDYGSRPREREFA